MESKGGRERKAAVPAGGLTHRGPSRVAAMVLAALALACHRRESPEATRARSTAAFRRAQIARLETVIAQAERGELVTTDQIAIGISEEAIKSLMSASLPREAVVASRLNVRIETAEAIFRGDKAAVVFRARASSVKAPQASATVELAGALEQFRLEDGKLLAKVVLLHFTVLESSVGDLAADVLDALVRANTAAIEAAIPPIQIPVHIEQSIRIAGLTEGAVVAKPGSLPLTVAVSQVLPINQRLWVLLQAKAGPWVAAPPGEAH